MWVLSHTWRDILARSVPILLHMKWLCGHRTSVDLRPRPLRSAEQPSLITTSGLPDHILVAFSEKKKKKKKVLTS